MVLISKMHLNIEDFLSTFVDSINVFYCRLSHPVAKGAVRAVVVRLLFIVALIVCGGSVFGPRFVVQ